MTTLTCMVCSKEFEGPEPLTCCSGRDCGCMGMPVDPIVCSKKCYNNLPYNKQKRTMEKLEKNKQKLWIKVYTASIANGHNNTSAERCANQAVTDFSFKFKP